LRIEIPCELLESWHQFYVSRVVDHYADGQPLEHAEAEALMDINVEYERRQHVIALRIGREWGSPRLN
jgi:hypothetical protein